MKCVICGKACAGLTCSAKCRKAKSRCDIKCDIRGCDKPSVTRCDIVILDDIEHPTRSRTTGCKCAIPGDEDYVGCVVDGKVVRPTAILPKDMTRTQLEQAIRAYPHDQWVNSPEHKELLRRLNVMSVEELEGEGYFVPAWKVVA